MADIHVELWIYRLFICISCSILCSLEPSAYGEYEDSRLMTVRMVRGLVSSPADNRQTNQAQHILIGAVAVNIQLTFTTLSSCQFTSRQYLLTSTVYSSLAHLCICEWMPTSSSPHSRTHTFTVHYSNRACTFMEKIHFIISVRLMSGYATSFPLSRFTCTHARRVPSVSHIN